MISVIIPVYNAKNYLNLCLLALSKTSYTDYEIIVVDDHSSDGSAEVAKKYGVSIYRRPKQTGPAGARNYGAQQARGDILLFIDADVVVPESTIGQIAAKFEMCPDIAALFGSYDSAPSATNFMSQYKNLFHHFVHQKSNYRSDSFWAGCGAVRKEVFQKVGGFNATKYTKPCIEDIELGYRLKENGYEVILYKQLQVKHLKKWTLWSLLHTDIFYRAVPWSMLILNNNHTVEDLNLKQSQKICAALALLSMASFFLGIVKSVFLIIALLHWIIIGVINADLFIFFYRQNGFGFCLRSFFLLLAYYVYSGITFLLCWIFFKGKQFIKAERVGASRISDDTRE